MKKYFIKINLCVILHFFASNSVYAQQTWPNKNVSIRCGTFNGEFVWINAYTDPHDANVQGNRVVLGHDTDPRFGRPRLPKNPKYEVTNLEWGKEYNFPNNAKFGGLRCNDDVVVTENYLSIRHGNNLDLLTLVGFDGKNYIRIDASLIDGRHIGIERVQDGPLIYLGRNKDVRLKYCFDGRRWTSSLINRPNVKFISISSYEVNWVPGLDCEDDYVSYFNGSYVEHTPKRLSVCSGYPTSYHVNRQAFCKDTCTEINGRAKILQTCRNTTAADVTPVEEKHNGKVP